MTTTVQNVRVLIAGDRKCGRDTVIGTLLNSREELSPGCRVEAAEHGDPALVGSFLRAGQPARMRFSVLPQMAKGIVSLDRASAYAIIFSVDSPASLHNAEKWKREASPASPVVLVCANVERRDDSELVRSLVRKSGRGMLTAAEGLAEARRIGAVAYIEFSSVKGIGAKLLFDALVKATLEPQSLPKL